MSSGSPRWRRAATEGARRPAARRRTFVHECTYRSLAVTLRGRPAARLIDQAGVTGAARVSRLGCVTSEPPDYSLCRLSRGEEALAVQLAIDILHWPGFNVAFIFSFV